MHNFIYNQRAIAHDQWRYGLRTSAATGCGWIATYNALQIMGCYASPEELIAYYEHQLPLIHGNAGTSFWAPAVFFKSHGFSVRTEFRRNRFDETAKSADACVLFYRWRKGAKIGAHFVALTVREGTFIGYNTFRNSVGEDRYGESLETFLNKRKYFGAVLFALNR